MVAKKDAKSENATSNASAEPADVSGVPNFDKWVEEQVGFAPYWNPEPEKWFFARVVARDERDPEFVRYLMQAGMPLNCKRGPADDAEDVAVKPGEHFSFSVYHSLRDTFDFYLETGLSPFLRVQSIKEVKTKTTGQTCWTWKVLVSPQDKKILEKKREEMRQLATRSDAEEFPPQMNR